LDLHQRRRHRRGQAATGALKGAGGAIEVYNGKVAVVNMRPGRAGGGYIQLLDAGGQTAVEAGVSPEGVGVVRAGPRFKCIWA
jgi:hypothetical protein